MSGSTSLFGAIPGYARLRRSQYWDERRWAAHRGSRLRETLAAAARIPFYLERFGGASGDVNLARLPVLRRAEVGQLAASVRALSKPGTRFESDLSSGSTGMPAGFIFDRAHQRGRFAARARYLLESGWSPLHRSGWVIYLPHGTPDARIVGHRLLFGTRFLSVFTDLDEQKAWLERLDPHSLYTLPSSLKALVERMSRSSLPSLRCIMTGGEVVEETLRQKVRRAFGLEIADNYGSTEAFMAWRCPRGRYHVNAEHVLIEIVDESDRPAAPGQIGRVLVTTLQNRRMPLVRYEIGDYAQQSAEACPCGRTLPVIGGISGRAVQLFRFADGRFVTPWELIVRLRVDGALRQFQIVQKTYDRFALRHVSDAPLSAEVRDRFTREFADVLRTSVRVDFERVESIPRTPTGKYLTALSELSGGERPGPAVSIPG
jgi:phenylacetate-CoA ligase